MPTRTDVLPESAGVPANRVQTLLGPAKRDKADPAPAGRQCPSTGHDRVSGHAEARYLSTHKAWHAIAFVLERAGFPVDIVYGEERFADDEDLGYGPPRYLTAQRVRTAADLLAVTSFDALTAGVSPATLAQADLYPQVWDEPESLEWVRGWYEPLVSYFAKAARDDHALLVWLD